jgi:hypothetical protein
MTVPQVPQIIIAPGYDLRASGYGGTLTYEPYLQRTVVRLTGSRGFHLTIDHPENMVCHGVKGRPLFANEAVGDKAVPELQHQVTPFADDMVRLRVDSLDEPSFWLEVTFVVYAN